MNYYQPREQMTKDGQPSGLWHYTRMNDGRIWPTGYCAESCPGHATPEEAREHQRQYELNHARYDGEFYPGRDRRPEHRCQFPDCPNWTMRFAMAGIGGMLNFPLCDTHLNRDGLAAVYTSVGDVTSSY